MSNSLSIRQPKQARFALSPVGWLFLLSIGVIVGVVWHQVGFSHRPLFEDWGYIASFERNDYYVDHVRTRILRVIPHIIGYHTDPDSQLGNNLMLLFVFVSRGLFSYWIFRRIFPQRYLLPMSTALLTMVYPVGTGYFTARTLEGNFAWSMALLSIGLLFTYWRQPRQWLWPLIWLTQIISLLSYELLYLPALIVPLILLWSQNPRHSNSYWRKTSFRWLLFNSLLLGVYIALTLTGQNNYISEQMAGQSVSLDHLPQYIDNIGLMYRLHVVEWQDTFQLARDQPTIFSGLWLFLASALWFVARHETQILTRSPAKFTVFEILSGMLGGLVWMFLAFVIFVPIAHIVASGFRLYFASGIGAAWLIMLSLNVMRDYIPRPFMILPIGGMALFISLGTLQMHQKNLDYAEDAWAAERLWATIIEQAPELQEDAQIIVIDEGHYYHRRSFQGFPNVVLNFGMNYMYEENRLASFCVLQPSKFNQCIFTGDHLVLKSSLFGTEQQFNYENLVIFTVLGEGEIYLLEDIPTRLVEAPVETYNPRALIIVEAPPPARAFSFLQCFPLSKCDGQRDWLPIAQTESIQFDFQEPMNYPGWEAQPRQGEWLWTLGPQAILPIYLEPHQAYVVQIRAIALDETVLNDISITIDQKYEVPLGWEYVDNIVILQAYIPAGVIPNHATMLEINLGTRISLSAQGLGNDDRELGLSIDQVVINPIAATPRTEIEINFDQPIYGRHWERYRAGATRRWVIGESSEIDVWLQPQQAYTVRFEVEALTVEILQDVKLFINGEEIELESEILAESSRRFTGLIPPELVQIGPTTLQFHTDQTITPQSLGLNEDTRPLSLRFTTLQIETASTP